MCSGRSRRRVDGGLYIRVFLDGGMSHGLKRVLMDMNRRLGMSTDPDEMSDGSESKKLHTKLSLDIDATDCSIPDLKLGYSNKFFLYIDQNIAMLTAEPYLRTFKFEGNFDFNGHHTADVFYKLMSDDSSGVTLNCYRKKDNSSVYQKKFVSFKVWEGVWNISPIQIAVFDPDHNSKAPYWDVNFKDVSIEGGELVFSKGGGLPPVKWRIFHTEYEEFSADKGIYFIDYLSIGCTVTIISYNQIALHIETRGKTYSLLQDTASYLLTRNVSAVGTSIHSQTSNVKILELSVDLTTCSDVHKMDMIKGYTPVHLYQHENVAMITKGIHTKTYRCLGKFDFHAIHTGKSKVYYTLTGDDDSVIQLNCYAIYGPIEDKTSVLRYTENFVYFKVSEGRWSTGGKINTADGSLGDRWVVPLWDVYCDTIAITNLFVTMSGNDGVTKHEWSIDQHAGDASCFYARKGTPGVDLAVIQCTMYVYNYNRIALKVATLGQLPGTCEMFLDTVYYNLDRKL
jgi:hypothetical protein